VSEWLKWLNIIRSRLVPWQFFAVVVQPKRIGGDAFLLRQGVVDFHERRRPFSFDG
jgi:hypothetical protein